MRLQGKVAIITGGGSGIGQVTSVVFGREGASVVVADVNVDAAEDTANTIIAAGGTACVKGTDVTKDRDVRDMVKTAVQVYGKLDILFNNAGIGARGDVVELSEAEWNKVMDVNLKSVFLSCKHAIPEMIKNDGGVIINTASMWVQVGGSVSCVYPATKAGVVAFSKNTALAYAGYNIRVNCVCPGHIETPLILDHLKDAKLRKELTDKYPIGRLGKPIDVAYAVLFLASDEASFITGTELVIDGGYTAQ